MTQHNSPHEGRGKRVSIGRFSVPVPQSRALRVALGVALILGGVVGFLPVLGFWMIPLGLLVLSHDFAPVRRFRRRVEVWWARRRKKKQAAETNSPNGGPPA